MSKKVKIILSVFSLIVIGFIIYDLVSNLNYAITYLRIKDSMSQEWMRDYKKVFNKTLITIIRLFLSILLLLAFNFLMWFKNLFGIPLTPEQAAERKRIKQERRKARLQEKLNKLN